MRDGLKAVSTRVVVKDEKTLVSAVNLTNKEALLNLKINGSRYFGSFDHKALSFAYIGAEPALPIKANPLKEVTGSILDKRLPKFSINVIYLEEPNINTQQFSVAIGAPGINSRLSLGRTIQLRAPASTNVGAIEQVNFRIDGIYLNQDKTAPYKVSWEPGDASTYKIDVVAIREDGNQNVSSSRTVNVGGSGGAYVHLAEANAPEFALDRDHGGSEDQTVKLWSRDLKKHNQQGEELNRGNNSYSYRKLGTEFYLDGGNDGDNEQNVKLWKCELKNKNQYFQKESKGSRKFQLKKRNTINFSID